MQYSSSKFSFCKQFRLQQLKIKSDWNHELINFLPGYLIPYLYCNDHQMKILQFLLKEGYAAELIIPPDYFYTNEKYYNEN